MKELFEFLSTLHSTAGTAAVFGFLLIIAAILVIFATIIILWKTSNKNIDARLEEITKREKEAHIVGNKVRRAFTESTQDLLYELAENTDADRALVFEYSNGTQNLIGIPFLYASVTVEVTRPGVNPVAMQYQRMNLSIFNNFLSKLESVGFVCIEDIENIKDTDPIVYSLLKGNNVKSAIFYSLEGIHEPIGFIVITTIKEKVLCAKNSLSELLKTSQKICSAWNIDDIESKKPKQWWKM